MTHLTYIVEVFLDVTRECLVPRLTFRYRELNGVRTELSPNRWQLAPRNSMTLIIGLSWTEREELDIVPNSRAALTDISFVAFCFPFF
jgi:hypothetical protein